MDPSSLFLYGLSLVLLLFSFSRDRKKTRMALKKGWKAFVGLVPLLLPLFLIVGVLLAVVSPSMIQTLLGESSGFMGVIAGLLMGSVAFMPPFVVYPLAAELLEQGAGYPQIAAFVTTLMGVGLVYWAAETEFFGRRLTLLRNSLAFVASALVALVMWGVM